MKILYIHQYFITPEESGGARSYYLARKLAEAGNEVVVITGNNQHKDWPLIHTKSIDGFTVKYVKNAYASTMSNSSRILSFLRFVLYSTYLALREKNVAVVYASSTPITVGIPALALKFFKNTKFILELRDLWPDVPYEMGYINSKAMYRFLKWFEHLLYRKADKIITISDGIRDKVDSDYHAKAFTYPFGANIKLFDGLRNTVWRTQHGIDSKTLFVYTGAVGIANGVEYLVEAAHQLQVAGESNVHIAIVGDGSAKAEIVDLIKKYQLSNVSMHEPVPIHSLADIYASADAGIVLFADKSEIHLHTGSPNKLFDYIAAGLPVFFNFTGPLRTTIVEADAGVYTDYKEPKTLSDAMRHFAANPHLLETMSKKSRALAEVKFNREDILHRLAEEVMSTSTSVTG